MRENCTYGSMRGSRRKTAKSVLRVVEDRAGVPDNKGRPALLYTLESPWRPCPRWGVNEKRKVFMRVDERLFYIFRTSGDFASVHERSTHGGRVPCFTSCAWA